MQGKGRESRRNGVGVGIQLRIQYIPVKQFKEKRNCTIEAEGVA